MNNDHIPIEEIQKDIADTLSEIIKMQKEEEGLRMVGDRMSIFRADARLIGIEERKVFISKLEAILAERGNR